MNINMEEYLNGETADEAARYVFLDEGVPYKNPRRVDDDVRYQFRVKCSDDLVYIYVPNYTSLRSFCAAFGRNTSDWVSRGFTVKKRIEHIGNNDVVALYATPERGGE